MDLGKAIKICRNQKGLTQTKLAESAEISVSYLSLLEKGKRDPALSVLTRLCEVLGLPLNLLLFIASSKEELKGLPVELFEKLSSLTLNLMKEDDSD